MKCSIIVFEQCLFENVYLAVNPSPGNVFLRRLLAKGGGEMAPNAHLEYSTQQQNSNGYTYVFRVKLSNDGTSDFAGCRRVRNPR